MTKKGVTKKDRRHSGRAYTVIYHPNELPYEEEKYDDWEDFRDGFREKRSMFKSWKHKTKKRKQWMKTKRTCR